MASLRYGRAVSTSSEPVVSGVTVCGHRCHDAWVVVQFARVAVLGAGVAEEHLHRRAAIAGVAALTGTHADRIEQALPLYQGRHEYLVEIADGWRRAATEAALVSPDALTGRRITLKQFYGPDFDATTGILHERSTYELDNDFGQRGIVAALLYPPYGIKPDRAGYRDERELLIDVITDVICAPDITTPIWHWTGDWCRYFDAGNDWWGAAAWTLRVGPDEILTAAASSTD